MPIGVAYAKQQLWPQLSTHRAISISVVLFGVFLVGILWTAVLTTVQTDRAQTIRAAQQRNAGLAIAFEQYTIRIIESADAILRALIREYARSGEKIDLPLFISKSTVDNKSLVGVVLADEPA